MKKYFNVILSSRLFSGMSEKDISSVIECLSAKISEYKKNEYIFHSDEKIDSVGLILDGSAIIIKEDYWGTRTVISKLRAGQIFGEAYVASERPLSVSVVAGTDCSVMMLDLDGILTRCSSGCTFHTQLIHNLVMLISEKNLLLDNHIEHISKHRIRDKTLSYLSECSRKSGSSEFEIPFNRQELADYLCVDRSALSNELSNLRNEKIIEFERNKFKIL